MPSCFGSRKRRGEEDTEPLLPQYDDDTTLQRTLHQKLHSYQMLRALSQGYMPSTDQLIINLRTILASEVLRPEIPELSPPGHLLLKHAREWLAQFIELLRNKNDADYVQDFIWFTSKAKLSVDTADMLSSVSTLRRNADVSIAYESLKTVGALLLGNTDFRILLTDLNIIARQVFADAAGALSSVASDVAEQVEPSHQESDSLKRPGNESEHPMSTEEMRAEASDVAAIVADGLSTATKEAGASIVENVSGNQRATLLFRLRATVTNLRKRTDYQSSVSTIGFLIQRYAKLYSRAVDETISTVKDDVNTNPELDRAVQNLWKFFCSFGDHRAWEGLQVTFDKVMAHSNKDPQFEQLMGDFGGMVQRMFMDPAFFDNASGKIDQLRDRFRDVGTNSSLRGDIDDLLAQAKVTFDSVWADKDVANLVMTTKKIIALIAPSNPSITKELVDDALQVFLPLMVSAIQYIPIPRLEVSVPEIDLLLENLILEPGRTINHSSFLPFRLRVETFNDFEITKARFRTQSTVTSRFTIKAEGLSIRADEIGFWLRAHRGLLRLADEGIASFELDERGIDIHIDVEVGKERVERVLALRGVTVKIHHLSYTLRRSKFACLAWVLKPLLRPLLRRVLEAQLASAIKAALHAANRELVYARERLRATRISDPQDVRTFLRAVLTRLTPADGDPDVYTSVGVSGSGGPAVFAGVYAPGSVVKLWEDEARRVGEIIDDNAQGRWRNEIFDVPAPVAA